MGYDFGQMLWIICGVAFAASLLHGIVSLGYGMAAMGVMAF